MLSKKAAFLLTLLLMYNTSGNVIVSKTYFYNIKNVKHGKGFIYFLFLSRGLATKLLDIIYLLAYVKEQSFYLEKQEHR